MCTCVANSAAIIPYETTCGRVLTSQMSLRSFEKKILSLKIIELIFFNTTNSTWMISAQKLTDFSSLPTNDEQVIRMELSQLTFADMISHSAISIRNVYAAIFHNTFRLSTANHL